MSRRKALMNGPHTPYVLFHRLCGTMALSIAIIVLIGWQTDNMYMKAIVPGITPMNPVTAGCFLLSGLWILFTGKADNRIIPDILAWVIMIIGAIHFLTYFIPIPAIRMDDLLYGDVIRNSNIPNMIAPNTALNFILCGSAMLLSRRGNKRTQVMCQAMLIVSFLLVYISLLGYLFNIQPAYRFGGLTPMALITSIAFLFVVMGLFYTDVRYGLSKAFSSSLPGGKLLRRSVPFILVFAPGISYVTVIGEQYGWFSQEFGAQLSTFLFTISLVVFILSYAILSNKKLEVEKMQDEKIAALMDSLNDAVLELDEHSRIAYVNPAFEKIMGYKRHEIIGKQGIDVLVPNKDRERYMQRIQERKTGIEETYVNELVTASGVQKYISLHSKPIQDQKGRYKGTLVTLRDITDETHHLQDLQAFNASAAHDLNAPLASIQMLADAIDRSGLTEEQMDLVNYMSASARKMRQLLEDLLHFSKLGSASLKKEKVDVGWIIREILDLHDISKVQLQIQDDLPMIEANTSATRQLFTNLISNAIKYSSAAERPEVRIHSFRKDGRTWFYVSDNGIGIDEDLLPELFKPFKRFTGKFEGNGMGLAIVKRIVEKHGGSIEAKRNADEGMRFEFTLDPEIRHT